MSLPTQACNLVGSQCFTATDLGLAQALASGAISTSTPFSSGIPATILLIGKLASAGSVVANIATSASSSITFTSGASATFSGTNRNYNTANTSTSALFVGIRLTDGGNSANFQGGEFSVFCLYGLTTGEDAYSVTDGFRACASTKIGDGSGVLTLGPS